MCNPDPNGGKHSYEKLFGFPPIVHSAKATKFEKISHLDLMADFFQIVWPSWQT